MVTYAYSGTDIFWANIVLSLIAQSPRKAKVGLMFLVTFLVMWDRGIRPKECHNCVFKSITRISDASVHMNYYIAPLTKTRHGRKVY